MLSQKEAVFKLPSERRKNEKKNIYLEERSTGFLLRKDLEVIFYAFAAVHSAPTQPT